MPRRSNARAPNLHSSITASPPPPHHDPHTDNLALLRRQWRWAAFSQFFCTFSPLFAMNDVRVVDIETDLVQGTSVVIPRVMQKLLYTLSYDRKVSVDNWQTSLRKQYNKRDPQANPIGPDPKDIIKETEEVESLEAAETSPQISLVPKDEGSGSREFSTEPTSLYPTDPSRQSSVARNSQLPDSVLREEQQLAPSIDWFDLPMLSKLESMHNLAEWQFQNPMRLRTIMKTDDEAALWRIEPIGYDSKRNAYWLIGGDRLWIQRVPPKMGKAKGSKRKRAPEKEPGKADSKVVSTPAKRARLNAKPSHLTPSGRHSRAAKDQAKLKLDVQAKELAELTRADFFEQKSRTSRQQPSRAPPRALGTRTSARLRGAPDGDWQSIPDEWLDVEENSKSKQAKGRTQRTGLESDEDSISDLTELSEEVSESSVANPPEKGDLDEENKEPVSDERKGPEKVEDDADGFVEWETICTYLHEWEHFPEKFEKATHYSEKALYKTLVNDIVPAVTHELREIQEKRELEEALIHRKRSSRLALRESEREEARLAAKRKQEDEEKNSRARRMEARLQKEESERIKRENAREKRRMEREAREESRKEHGSVGHGTPESQTDHDVASTSHRKSRNTQTNGTNGSHSGSRTPAGEDWELSCEICHRQGINLDDGTPMMSCGRCLKWQHIICHDRADQAAGRPRRNWDSVDFICKSCRLSQQTSRHYPVPMKQPLPSDVPPMHAYRPYPPQPLVNHSSVTSAYSPSYKDPAPQSFYVRPSNGQQPNTQSPYSPGPSSSHVVPPPRPAIAFSHYQPAAQGFSPGAHKSYPDAHYPYNYPNQQYNQVVPTPYKPQNALPAAWNITTPAHAPGYGGPHVASGSISGPTSYSRSIQPEHQVMAPMTHEPQSQPSFARYSPEQHYSSTQFKRHPAPYQPPLGR